MAKHKPKLNLPGTIYLNKNRYWWKVKLPGEKTTKARPLRPVGARFATTDRNVAEEVAHDTWQSAVFKSKHAGDHTGDVASLVRAYIRHAEQYYCGPDGKPTREPENIRYAVVPLVECYPALAAEEFGPLKLKKVRQKMIDKGWCRGVVNQRIGIVKRMFKWAASEQYVPASVYHSLQTVEGLRRGRSGARETEPISPVAENHVRAILPFTTHTVSAMVQLQLLTGMRSTELCLIRPCDIETTGRVWFYKPSEHKTKYRGHNRVVALGPKAQKILRRFLKRKLDDYCFSPQESLSQREPMQGKAVNAMYDKDSYRKAIGYAIRAARKAGLKVPDFHPHQLRHTAATKIRKQLGLDAARAMLGHRNLKITDDYAELDQALAGKAALEYG